MYFPPYPHDSIAVISRPKGGILRHIGVLLPDGRVAHCAPGRGEHVSSAEEFAAGQDVTIVRTVPTAEIARTLRRVADAMRSPKAYDAVANNCDMFANRVVGGESESSQLRAAILLLAIAAVLLIAASK